MVQPSRQRIVAVMVNDQAGIELDVVRGVLAYKEHAAHWQLASRSDLPFEPTERIDPTAIDGIIGSFSAVGSADPFVAAGIAVVNTSNRHADLPLPRVGADDQAIGRMAGEHLLERGFARYAFFPELGAWFSDQRLAGFREVIEEDAGLTCDVFDRSEHRGTEYRTPSHDWLANLPKPIAIFGATDNRARWLIDVATDLGLGVPDDVAVLGVDNHEWLTAIASVPLSSIDVDGRQIGYRAAKALDGMMAGETPPPDQWIPPVGVVTRRSTDIHVAEDEVVVEALRLIRDGAPAGLGVEEVLAELGISRRKLEVRMKKAVGYTPHVAIIRAKIERAKKLLVESDLTMGQIARACGFNRQEGFSVGFKRHTGLTPGQFRQQRGRGR